MVDMTAATESVAAVIKNATILDKARQFAGAHPIAAVVAGTVVSGLAVVGTYKLLQKAFTPKPETVVVYKERPAEPAAK